MTIEERKKQIEEHFESLTVEQFEENMIKAGIETIKPSGEEMIVEHIKKFKEEKSMEKLIWNDDMDMVYGVKTNFENEEDFIENVNAEYQNIRGNQCLISNVAIKYCISTGEGIDAESITPLEDTDIEINNYYIADVEEVE